jgi:adenylate cyclase class 2
VYEVEVKVEADHAPVRERLRELGADAIGLVHQRDTYYDHPVRSFAESDEALRLRRESSPGDDPPNGEAGPTEEPSATLTYKGPLVDDVSKSREEVETDVADPESASAILRAVGFESTAVVEKERERYAVEGYLVALDAVSGLGTFVEIEGTGEETDVEVLREGALDLCRRLGLDPDDSTTTSYLGLLLGAADE